MKETGFGAYDIRGHYPDVINEQMAYRVGRGFVESLNAKTVVVGNDIRLSGNSLKEALIKGLVEAGCHVYDIGQCGTEMIYFSTVHLKTDGGIMITASHNPKEYNGMKFVRKNAQPLSRNNGLKEIEDFVLAEALPTINVQPGFVQETSIMQAYIEHLLSYIDLSILKPLKIVVNAGNGAAGPILDQLEKVLPFEMIKVFHQPDGNFPNGVPNPLLPDNRQATAEAVRQHKADIGIAWDGDFDRCFFFDENGDFIEGYYVVGFLAEAFLAKNKGAKIVHDPRLYWNTVEIVTNCGGIPVISKSGHSIIKETMRKSNAIYGGEMSAHHYFKDFAYCDSGMIPWLLVLELLSRNDKPLSVLLNKRIKKYPCSGEINSKVADAKAVIQRIEDMYVLDREDCVVDKIDGLSVEYPEWRFNLRISNTEPLIRLNVEARNDIALMQAKTAELLDIIRQ